MSERVGLPRRGVDRHQSGKDYETSASFGSLVTALYTYVVSLVLAHYYIRNILKSKLCDGDCKPRVKSSESRRGQSKIKTSK